MTVMFASQKSADLSLGHRPMSKSAEFCDARNVIEGASLGKLK